MKEKVTEPKYYYFIFIEDSPYEISAYRRRLLAMIDMLLYTNKYQLTIYYMKGEDFSPLIEKEDTIQSDFFMNRYGNIITADHKRATIHDFNGLLPLTLFDCAAEELK